MKTKLKKSIGQESYQFAILKSIKHLQIAAALEAVKVRHMLPETIDTGECQKPL